ncbi:MAG: UDP-N-acetylglucosamine--N-acetylmuramyl-(pentapeptide) pyrophosphoryl-undecaprenol N-acetylglucosamine transferase, partial [Candidatus Saccharimonadales bacterium]
LSADYQPVTPMIMKQLKHQVGIKPDDQLLLVTGGGNGAEGLNQAVAENTPYLLKKYPKLHVAHIAGRALEKQLSAVYDDLLSTEFRKRVEVIGFTTDFVHYSGAADVIIARGGATNLAEFAVQGKACIIVPAEQLVGGHQVKNAQVLADRGAIQLFTQAQAEQERRLGLAVGELLDTPGRRAELGKNLSTFAKTDAAEELAVVLLDIAKK